jgi:N-methylhydantoinase A/oxoprolinase/acetone carboxylase beta subunit
MRRIGVDVGGTFTDLIYVDDDTGQVLVHKLATTPDDPSQGTVQGVRELADRAGVEPASLDQVFHGTTIATNIVIEHSGARVGMITTEGYRDILHIARHKKPLNFSNYQDLPWQRHPIVRRRHRLTVPERITGDGEVLVPLDEEAARDAARRLRAAGVEAVSVCFLFSFVNPAHERRVAEIVREELPDAFLSVSSDVLPQYREYERFSTVSLNAYVGPKVARYIRRLEDELRALRVRTGVHLMTSASGVVTAEGAAEKPVTLLMSGPVAGVVGGIWAGRQAGFDSVITLDVGGTSADIGLAVGGRLRMKHLLDTRVGPYQAMIPMVDVDTIGAGGGSIAYLDQGGIFRVGPRSAGAEPGPAAYDRGGAEPTATDAMVNLGWLDPERFLGGAMALRPDLARRAFAPLAEQLGMSVEEASMGAVRILCASMVHAIEENSVRKGFDPRDFALVAEGGAGPAFAAHIAPEVGTPTVLVPPHPGITSAMGLLATDVVYEHVATAYQKVSDLDAAALEAGFEALERRAREQLERDGIPPDRQIVQRVADCRYLGQGYELRVDWSPGPIDDASVARAVAAFHDAHEREYSRRFEESDIEIPNIRVRGIGVMPPLSVPEQEPGGAEPPAGARHREGQAWFRVDGELRRLPTRYYEREALRAGNRLEGPAIVNQYDSTTVIPPGFAAQVDRFGNLVISVEHAVAPQARVGAPAEPAVAA